MDGSPRSERLRLRFVTHAESHLLNERYAHDSGGFNDFGEPTKVTRRPGSQAEHAPGDALRDDDNGMLWVERLEGGAPIGTVQYRRVPYGPNPESMAWDIGIELVAEARGQGFGAEAQRLLADWLFETTPANRVEAGTDAENHAEARALEKAGFQRDGVLRGAQFRAGAYHDLIVYSRLRDDPH
jgi:RimJ/RimL family protein N-acetyltransferase